MRNDNQPTDSPQGNGTARERVVNQDRRRLIGKTLVAVPVVMTLTAKPLMATVVKNKSNSTGCRYIACQ
ncbi:MAG: hypothetical protein U0P82_10560 [Vicinamibacterales bacterium]